MSDIVIIGGPPGGGKTRLARGLAEEFTPGVHLEADLFFHFIVSGYIAPWRPESNAQNQIVNMAVARAASAFATSDYTVIVDGINGPWFLDHLLANLEPLPDAVHYIIVTCEADLAVNRIHSRSDRADATRRYGTDIDETAIRFMHEQFHAANTASFQILDTTEFTAEQALTQCRARYSTQVNFALQPDRAVVRRQAHCKGVATQTVPTFAIDLGAAVSILDIESWQSGCQSTPRD